MSQCLSIGNPVLVCVCAGGGPVSGSFSTLLPSAFLILVELRPTPPQSYNTAKNLCMCQGEGSSPSSGDQMLVLWSVPCPVCQWFEKKDRTADLPESGRH